MEDMNAYKCTTCILTVSNNYEYHKHYTCDIDIIIHFMYSNYPSVQPDKTKSQKFE